MLHFKGCECSPFPRRISLIGAARRDAVPAGLSRNGTAGYLSFLPSRDVGHVVDGAAGLERQCAAHGLG